MNANLIGYQTKEELLQHLIAVARMGGDLFTLESLATLWNIEREFAEACPEHRVKVVKVAMTED